jgi:hypothetical protein
MKKEQFAQWLVSAEEKSTNVAKGYSNAINRISAHYSSSIKRGIDLYTLTDSDKLKQIADLYQTSGKYADFGNTHHGLYKAAIKALHRFCMSQSHDEVNKNPVLTQEMVNSDIEVEESVFESNNFTYERDLKSAIVKQIPELFPDYKIFGLQNEGVEYLIEGKRIDVLLEHIKSGDLLAIELKAGLADFRVFGQVSMYIGLLTDKFPAKKISGCIIAGSIDNSLKSASKITTKIQLKTYSMKLTLSYP